LKEIEAAAGAVDMPLRSDNANAMPNTRNGSGKTEESGLRGFSKRKRKDRADIATYPVPLIGATSG
jgi:hypothetical protein